MGAIVEPQDAPQRKGDRHGLDTSDASRNLHRPRDLGLPAWNDVICGINPATHE
jgi:hypothetical protein